MIKNIIKIASFLIIFLMILMILAYLFIFAGINTGLFLNYINDIENLNVKTLKMNFPFKISGTEIEYLKPNLEIKLKELQINPCVNSFIKQKIILNDINAHDLLVRIKNNDIDSLKASNKKSTQNKTLLKENTRIDTNIKDILKSKFLFDIIIKEYEIKNINIFFKNNFKFEKLNIYGNLNLKNNFQGSNFKLKINSEANSRISITKRKKSFSPKINIHIDKNKEKIRLKNDILIEEIGNKRNNYSLIFDIKSDLKKKSIKLNDLEINFSKRKITQIKSLKLQFDNKISDINFNNFKINLNIKNILKMINQNFYRIDNLQAEGDILIEGEGTFEKYIVDVNLKDINLDYKDIIKVKKFESKFRINGKKDKIEVKNNLSFNELKINYKNYEENLKRMNLISTINFNDFNKIESMKLKDLRFSIFEGNVYGNGKITRNKNVDLTFNIENLNFLKNYDIPLMAILNGKINIQGKSLRDIRFEPRFILEDIDYRNKKQNIELNIPKLTLSGKMFCNYESKSIYIEKFYISILKHNYLELKGTVISFKNPKIDLSLIASNFNLTELEKIYNGPFLSKMSGKITFKGEISSNQNETRINIASDFKNFNYQYDNIKINNMNGNMLVIYRPDHKHSIVELNIQKAKLQEVILNQIKMEIPISFSKSNYKEVNNNFFINSFSYNMYSGNKMEGRIYINKQNVYIKDIYSNFMGGQIGMDFTLDMKNKNFNMSLSGLNLNVRTDTKEEKKSEITFVSKIKKNQENIEGFFDMTQIEKDVLNNLLISLDPDKKNPEIKLLRERLNQYGVVPEKISMSISNGYVDIYPELGFRTKSILAAVLNFFVGEVEVEPIRKIPLERVLKEMEIE